MNKSDIVERLRDAMVEVDYGDRLMAADEIERLRAALAEQQERFISLAVAAAAEREAIVASILELIERARADGHLYDGDYALRTVADAIRAKEESR
jgi:hypothetical protein